MFPVLNTVTTTSTDFWKCNQKILAASKSLYARITGSSANPQLAREETEESPPPQRNSNSNQSCFLRNLIKSREASATESINQQACKDIWMCDLQGLSHRPFYQPCCQQLVGCKSCVDRWLDDHDTCLHCSSEGVIPSELKGVDELLSVVCALRNEVAFSTT